VGIDECGGMGIEECGGIWLSLIRTVVCADMITSCFVDDLDTHNIQLHRHHLNRRKRFGTNPGSPPPPPPSPLFT
jgi:hypothetical protein